MLLYRKGKGSHENGFEAGQLSNPLRGNESVRAMLREAAQDSLLCCSAITIGEIHAGMRDEELEKTLKLLNSLAVIDVDRKIAAMAGIIAGRSRAIIWNRMIASLQPPVSSTEPH